MKKDKKFLNLIKNINNEFIGWDFAYITRTGRMDNEMLTWSYGSQAIQFMQNAKSALDMGTGGGEFLSMLQPFPDTMYATEGYIPNVPIAKNRLEPLGVKVVQRYEDNKLPFENAQFDLILNQHESFCAKEVRRVLSEGGTFFTQQVGGLDCSRINEYLGVPINKHFSKWNLNKALDEIIKSGFNIVFSKEEFPVQRFYDVGALIYYLKAIPWQVPNFNTEKHMDGFTSVALK